jgi:hypothetical protein
MWEVGIDPCITYLKLYGIRKKIILDPCATMHQQAGTGIWRCNTPKYGQKQQHKKVVRNKHNRNWQGSRHNDVEADDQVFGANEVEIKQKTLEALRLLRQADHTLDRTPLPPVRRHHQIAALGRDP